MKMFENSKYEYWKWVLIQKAVEISPRKYITAVYNPIEDIIFRFDINKGQKIKTNWDKGLDYVFNNHLAECLTIDNLEEFYKSLPQNKKQKFWKCLSRSYKWIER